MKKKYVSILLAGCMAVSMMTPAGAVWADENPVVAAQGTVQGEKTAEDQEMITDQQPETEEEKPAEEPVVSESQDIGEGEKETVAEEEKSGDSLSTDNNAENELEVQAATNRWVRSGNRWWYCHRDGSYTKDDWEAINGVWYYFDQSGWMVTGWLKKPEGWYYLNPSTGAMATGWASINGEWYFFNSAGRMVTGWLSRSSGWYYLSDSGAMVTGWLKKPEGWYYLNPSTGAMATGWANVNGKWYFLNSAGRMVTGWLSRPSGWYYLSDSGAMATGWQYIRNAWYYLEEGNGNMVTGWKQVGNNWYYLQSSGAMAANTWIGDYYVNGSGVWVQGYWVQSGNRWWYANPDGTYPKNGWKTIQSKQYYFDKDGWMVTGWLKIGSAWYYLNPSGERAYDQWVGTPKAIGSCYISKYGKAVTGTTYSLGDYIYTFDANGYCTKKENRYSYATDSKNGKTYKVEKQYDTDASNMSEDDFLAAAVYAESANQGLTGMTGVAMVMLNRMANAAYPSDARIMIYQASQFEVARDGALTKAIAKLNSSETAMKNAKEAVRKAREIRAAYQKDGTVTPIEGLNVPAGHTIFEYLGFMTPAAFQSSNLDPVKTAMFTYKNTAFYTSWIKKS